MHPKKTTLSDAPRPSASRHGLADFDEQLWPVNLLLLLLAACLAGVIVVKSDFAAVRWVNNGWLHLAALAAIVTVLAWGIVRLQGRVRRRMQFGVFLSLLVHLWLCLLSYNLHLSTIAQRERDVPEEFDEPAPVTLPDYQWQDESTNDATDPTLDTPVETLTPESEQEVERTEPLDEPKERPVEREPEPRLLPTPTALERAEMSAPRRAEELAGERLSRQERRIAETNEQAAVSKVAEAEEKAIDASVRVERAQSETTQNRPDAPAALPNSQPSSAALARQPVRESTPELQATAMAREQQQAAESLRPAEVAVERVRETSNTSSPLAPGKVDVAQTEVEPRVARRSRPVRESPTVVSDASVRRAQSTSANREPHVVSRAATKIARSISQLDAVSAPIAAAQPAASARAETLAEATIGTVGRSAAALPDAAQTAATASAPTSTNVSAAEMAAVRDASNQPAVTTSSVAASRRIATASIANAAAPELMTGSSANANEPTAAQPASAALTKAAGGAVGLTRQQHFDAELPGMNTSPLAQSAARRAQATQTFEIGPATAPSQPAQIAKARAGAEIPAAAMHADSVAVADMAASSQPAMRESSSSAAAQRIAAAAPRGRVTAAVGSGTIDQGLPQINSPIGEGRTSGGGLPSLSGGNLQGRLTKATDLAGVSAAAAPVAAELPREVAGGSVALTASTSGVDRLSSRTTQLVRGETRTDEISDVAAAMGGAEVNGRRSEATPSIATELASGIPGRSRADGGTVEGGADAPEVPHVEGGSSAEAFDNEPASASDLVRQSSGGLPAMVMGDAGGGKPSPSVMTVAEASRQSTDERPGVVAPGGGMTRGRIAQAASIESSVAAGDFTGAAVADATGGSATGRAANMASERQAAALPVLAAAPPGAGGLAPVAAVDIGVPSRRARPESELAHLDTGRLILERAGGNRAAEVRVQDVAVPGFRQRDRQMREALARQRGGSEGSERAVEMGLDFLARHQNVDGSWSLQNFSQGRPGYESAGDGQMVSDTAATGLAMLAFLGAGYTHSDGKYRLAVGRGLSYLLGNQKADGDLFLPQESKSNLNVWLYSHGIASIALCEAYGMTRDPTLRQPAQRAIEFIVASQHPTEGGWRYAPRQGSDTSVSGWQLMAMKSGELAGLQVPAAAYARVNRWLDGAQSARHREQYVYRPKSTREHQRTASRVMTAEALLMRQYLGWKRDNAAMTAGADYLMTQLPEWTAGAGWQRDSYYWYYATQVMFQMGDQHWDAWNERLRPLLVEKQMAEGPLAGSWEPLGDVPDRWGHEGGRIYVTAMHLLMLEVYYRHLPLYRTLESEP